MNIKEELELLLQVKQVLIPGQKQIKIRFKNSVNTNHNQHDISSFGFFSFIPCYSSIMGVTPVFCDKEYTPT